MANKEITIKLIKSPIGRVKRHRACVRGLGLRRMHHQVTVADTPENRGMINKIVDMLAIQES
ncbi:50S ribosomal protein L30 [Salinisphaera shabanensis T35B1]|mgnify:FL=1|jgi:large subunit ribosomal protein L30|uniref:Large ribosomal subunit protein uL30 n=1 Tax=Salinisphaera shabanensis E1L3A TaxID=1033802 RepID=U2FPD8_9GAMM|nr:50S ribosomal protein L30 [Salinisphaera shabanensis]ERJ18029.1 50S ribosomal protein L30 [Salinisphaera shabanensis E1L3A]|tara:strand:- start:287 stop:472 length:186 start_codon:yes stop_codon:yes gene_type:complete